MIGAHLNDQLAVLIRLQGFRALFNEVVAMDRQAANHTLLPTGLLHQQSRELARHLLQQGDIWSTDVKTTQHKRA